MDEGLAHLSAADKRELLARLLKEKANSGHSGAKGPREFPMSAGQQGLWYAFCRDPQLTAYNVFMPSRFRSPVNVDAMRRCIEMLVERHACLRTVFAEAQKDNHPIQRVLDENPPEFKVFDATGWNDQKVLQHVEEEVARPFDLTTGPLLRFAVFRIAHDDFVMVATTHHIVVDFWSLILLMNEVRELYPSLVASRAGMLGPAPGNYSAFVTRQADLVSSKRGEELVEHWRRRMEPIRPVLQWQTDFERPTRFTHRAAVESLAFTPGAAEKVAAIARRLNVTGNVVLMAVLQVFVARWTGQDSFSIGTPFSGRSDKQFESTVGFFVNVLPIGAELSGNPTFDQLVRAVGTSMVDALEHEELPFSEIVRACAPGRDSSRHPLFQVSCTFEKSQVESEQGRAGFLFGSVDSFEDFAGMRQESFFVPHPTCHYDVEFVYELGSSAVHGMICYCRDLFADDTAESMAEQFPKLLDSLLDRPNVPVKQVAWDVKQGSCGGLPRQRATVPGLLAASNDTIVTDAVAFASVLRDAGIGANEIVPVCLTKGSKAWSAILGVMMAGGCPVPIDADQPAVTLQTLIEDAAVNRVVAELPDSWHRSAEVQTIRFASQSLPAQGKPAQSKGVHEPQPDDLAYVVYTSGSTGKPKGVMVQHAAIANTLAWRQRAVTLSREDRVLILLSHQFDAAMAIVLSCLHQGAELIWLDQERLDLDALLDQLIRERITVLPAIPNLMRAIASHPRFTECTSIRQVWCGGESMPIELVRLIRSKRDCEIWNFYGPTESAVEATAHRVDQVEDGRPIPIGKPIDGADVVALDDSFNPVPVGVAGQLAIGGNGLALGYLNRPSETERSFVNLRGQRFYLTGDLARERGDGSFEFLGRLDHQVKVRGFRIELEEIERVLERHPHVRQAATKVVRSGADDEALAAFVVVDPGFSQESLTRHLSVLPPFKRPASIGVIESMPMGTSGKILRDQLPAPSIPIQEAREHSEPNTQLERFLSREFCATLDRDSIGAEENFFEAGGTSLQAAMLTSRLSSELGVSVPTSLLFDLGDVVSIGSRLGQLYPDSISARFGQDSVVKASSLGESLLADLKTTGTRPPLFMIHPPGGIVICYRELASQLHDQPLYAVRSRGLHGDEVLPKSMEEMAKDYARSIREHHSGPFLLGGWSLGGVIAYEVGRQLVDSGETLTGLVLLDSTVPENSDPGAPSAGEEYGIDLSLEQLSGLTEQQQLPFLYRHAENLGVLDEETPRETVERVIEDLRRLFAHHLKLCQDYELGTLDVDVLLLRPNEVPGKSDERVDRGWGRWVKSVNVAMVAGHHHSMIQMPGVAELAIEIEQWAGAR